MKNFLLLIFLIISNLFLGITGAILAMHSLVETISSRNFIGAIKEGIIVSIITTTIVLLLFWLNKKIKKDTSFISFIIISFLLILAATVFNWLKWKAWMNC